MQSLTVEQEGGPVTSNPVSSGGPKVISSAGKVTKAPPLVSSTLPQLSKLNDSPTSMITVHAGSLVFKLIASFVMHDAPTTDVPHGH